MFTTRDYNVTAVGRLTHECPIPLRRQFLTTIILLYFYLIRASGLRNFITSTTQRTYIQSDSQTCILHKLCPQDIYEISYVRREFCFSRLVSLENPLIVGPSCSHRSVLEKNISASIALYSRHAVFRNHNFS